MSESTSGAVVGAVYFWIVLIACQGIICAALSSYVAREKGYKAEAWFVIGLFFGFFALVAVAGLPSKHHGETASTSGLAGPAKWECPECKNLNPGTVFNCNRCGYKLK